MLWQSLKDFGSALPLPTQIVVNISRFTKGNIHYMIGGLIFLIIAFKKFKRTKAGRKKVDTLALKLPVLDHCLKKWPWPVLPEPWEP